MVYTRLAKLGNSQGFRIPRPLLDAAGIDDAVMIEVRGNEIVIRRQEGLDGKPPREGWAEAAKEMAQRDALAGEPLMEFSNPSDEEEWDW